MRDGAQSAATGGRWGDARGGAARSPGGRVPPPCAAWEQTRKRALQGTPGTSLASASGQTRHERREMRTLSSDLLRSGFQKS
ncbi:unnamed protein product [Rangifer tarandus platyrhynchus]|uniref:Uncharacterized protein n=1 Tax=Rangifer tarandus platyrhynchus TaxID=3082113 RepID=A0AC59ZCM1_RANTA